MEKILNQTVHNSALFMLREQAGEVNIKLRNKPMSKVTIHTGSHYKNTERNREARKELSKLLFSENNPLQEEFNRERLILDDTDGLISVISTSRYSVPDERSCIRLNDYIRKVAEPSGKEMFVFVGPYTFKE